MPSRWNLSGTEIGTRRHQVPVRHRFVQAIGVGRHAVFQVEQPVGVVVDLVLRRGRQADQQRIEVLEDGAVLLVHGAVGFVDDDQVEMPDAEAPLLVGASSISPIMVG